MAKAKKTKSTKAESQNIRTGGIYFSNEINCQIKIDADAEAGKKLVSCVNLFDGQELGEGGIEPTGTIEISENGEYDVKQYANANVNVPMPEGKIDITENGSYDIEQYSQAIVKVQASEPTGTVDITDNGTYNVKDYASANVNVPKVEYELIWENPQPTKSINAEIEIEMPENYRYVYIKYRSINNTDVLLDTWFEQNTIFNGCAWLGSRGSEATAGMYFARQIKDKGGGIIIGADCMQINGVDNNKNFRCIPYQIYTVKNIIL